jgi:hypothetical protein
VVQGKIEGFPIGDYTVDYSTPKTAELLDQLYGIDVEAYGSQAAPKAVLKQWVDANPQSIGLMCDGPIIAGAYGLLPISQEQAREFVAGDVAETDLIPLGDDIENHQFWYWSGIVVRPEYRGAKRSVLRDLLMVGIGGWLASKAVGRDQPLENKDGTASDRTKPLYLYATGCTPQGQALIDRFQFEKIRDDAEAPLYVREIYNRKAALAQIGKLLVNRATARSVLEEINAA